MCVTAVKNTPTMYLGSIGIMTGFDVARPKHVAKTVGDQDAHGWITAAFSRKMAGLGSQATFVATVDEKRRWDSTLKHANEELFTSAFCVDGQVLDSLGAEDEGLDRGGGEVRPVCGSALMLTRGWTTLRSRQQREEVHFQSSQKDARQLGGEDTECEQGLVERRAHRPKQRTYTVE